MAQSDASPTVVEVLRFDDLPADGELVSLRAVVRFSDCTGGEALGGPQAPSG